MKTITELFESVINSEQKFLKISNNLKAEINAYKLSKDELEKKYWKVLVDVKSTVDKRKKVNTKDAFMSWGDFKEILLRSKVFKEYDKDKLTGVEDFRHMMNN